MFQELTKDFPEDIRSRLRECLDRTRIQNPNDPIYELMIVLGTWAQYYQSIPASIKTAGEAVGRQNYKLHESLDRRVEVLHTIAQEIQAAVDQLEGMPKAIVEQFPSEALAKSIARKIDERFHALPTTKLEEELRSLAKVMETVAGTPGQRGLADRLDKGLTSLQESAQRLEKRGLVRDQWPRDVLFAVLGALLVGGVMWLFAVRPLQKKEPEMSDVADLMRREIFLGQRMMLGVNGQNERGMVIPASRIKSMNQESNGDIKVIFKESK